MYASASSIGLIVVEVDAVEDLVGNAKIERSGDNVPQLIKTGIGQFPRITLGELHRKLFLKETKPSLYLR